MAGANWCIHIGGSGQVLYQGGKSFPGEGVRHQQFHQHIFFHFFKNLVENCTAPGFESLSSCMWGGCSTLKPLQHSCSCGTMQLSNYLSRSYITAKLFMLSTSQSSWLLHSYTKSVHHFLMNATNTGNDEVHPRQALLQKKSMQHMLDHFLMNARYTGHSMTKCILGRHCCKRNQCKIR